MKTQSRKSFLKMLALAPLALMGGLAVTQESKPARRSSGPRVLSVDDKRLAYVFTAKERNKARFNAKEISIGEYDAECMRLIKILKDKSVGPFLTVNA